MKRFAILFIALGGWVLTTGCAHQPIIEAETLPSKKGYMELVGTGHQLVKRGTIDLTQQFAMPDQVMIEAWVLRAKTGETPARGTAVVLHGILESKAEYLPVAEELAKLGFDAVLIDLRCHGQSTGHYITLGAKEKMDVKRVIDTLIAQKKITPKPLYVFGANFGGATAIQYAAIEPNVAGVVAMAPWKDAASKARRDVGLLMPEDKFQATLKKAGETADFDPATTSAVRDVATLKCPVYLVHNMSDLIVPVSDSQAIYDAAKGPKELRLITPGFEEIIIRIGWQKWIANRVDDVAKGKLGKTPPKP